MAKGILITFSNSAELKLVNLFAHGVGDLRQELRSTCGREEAIRQAESESLDEIIVRAREAWERNKNAADPN